MEAIQTKPIVHTQSNISFVQALLTCETQYAVQECLRKYQDLIEEWYSKYNLFQDPIETLGPNFIPPETPGPGFQLVECPESSKDSAAMLYFKKIFTIVAQSPVHTPRDGIFELPALSPHNQEKLNVLQSMLSGYELGVVQVMLHELISKQSPQNPHWPLFTHFHYLQLV